MRVGWRDGRGWFLATWAKDMRRHTHANSHLYDIPTKPASAAVYIFCRKKKRGERVRRWNGVSDDVLSLPHHSTTSSILICGFCVTFTTLVFVRAIWAIFWHHVWNACYKWTAKYAHFFSLSLLRCLPWLQKRVGLDCLRWSNTNTRTIFCEFEIQYAMGVRRSTHTEQKHSAMSTKGKKMERMSFLHEVINLSCEFCMCYNESTVKQICASNCLMATIFKT